MGNLKKQIQDLVANNHLKEAIEILKNNLNGADKQAAIELERRFNTLSRNQLMNLLSFDDAGRESSKISFSVLGLADSVKGNADNKTPDNVQKTTTVSSGNPAPKGELFISYKWGEESGEIADKIFIELTKRGLKVYKDTNDIEYGESVRDFMEALGEANKIVVIISKKYLKSDNCMFELTQINDNKKFASRIFPIVLEDSNIYDPLEIVKYIQFWNKKIKKLEKALKSLGSAGNLIQLQTKLNQYIKVRASFDTMAGVLSDLNALNPETHQNENFESLYQALTK